MASPWLARPQPGAWPWLARPQPGAWPWLARPQPGAGAWLPPPQPGQDRGGGKTVRNEPDRGLVVAHRGARLGPQPSVRLAGVEALAVQQFLHLAALRQCQHRLMTRPRLHERVAAAQPVGEMADRHRIGLRRIVFHDDAEVVQHQEARTLIAGRHQQIGFLVQPEKRLATGALDAMALPFGERELPGTIG